MTRQLKWATHDDLKINRRPSVGREEYLDHMTFRRNERPLFTEIFGPIVGLKEEWEEQGATAAELAFSAFRYRCEERAYLPLNTGGMSGLPIVPISETESFRLFRDEYGRTMKLSKGVATLPLPCDYPVATMDDWLRIKHWYAFSEARFGDEWQPLAKAHHAAGRVVCVRIPGGFDEPRQLMGEEALCIAYYEQPELIADMLNTMADMAVRVLERASAAVSIDLLFVHEDMAGRSGPMIGPKLVKQFIAPYYRRIWDMLRERGARLFDQDSDGDMNSVIPAFLDAGVNCMHPMEPAANMDVVKIRQQFGDRLAFYGGIDKHVLRRSQPEIAAELEYKLPPLLASGGWVIGLDHRVPNGTPLENYRFYVDKVWEIVRRETGQA